MADLDRRVVTAVLIALGTMLAALLAAVLSGPAPRSAGSAQAVVRTGPNGVDLLFAEMMVAHHAQAVTMSETMLAKAGVPERVRNLAGFIAHDQQREIGEMNDWLRAWGRSPADPGRHGPGTGHGMLTDAQLAEITRADPAAASELYLRHMIEHHRGAITMARSALDGGANAYIRGLAKHIVNEQSAENDAMGRLLTELG